MSLTNIERRHQMKVIGTGLPSRRGGLESGPCSSINHTDTLQAQLRRSCRNAVVQTMGQEK
jgi:hypothetical protein